MESRVLGVRFDVVDSYAWHGTVDEISKVFAPLAMLELLRSSRYARAASLLSLCSSCFAPLAMLELLRSSLRPPFRLRPMGLESESSFV